MSDDSSQAIQHRIISTDTISGRERYELLTSLVVPRPIAWVSTRGEDGTLNLAPFSFFAAIASSPMLVSVSIGTRKGVAKDSFKNILHRRAFCVNVVTEAQLEAMNRTSAELSPDKDEFAHAGLIAAQAHTVDAPYVANCPAVLECVLFGEMDLGAPGSLIVGEVTAVRLDPALPTMAQGTAAVAPEALRPVGRLSGSAYALLGEVRMIERPAVPSRDPGR